MKTQQGGFTLIELVVVIVILGILAAVATPRFATLNDDARQAVVEGALGAFVSQAVINLAENQGPDTCSNVYNDVILDAPVTFSGTAAAVTVTHDDDGAISVTSGDLSSLCTGAVP